MIKKITVLVRLGSNSPALQLCSCQVAWYDSELALAKHGTNSRRCHPISKGMKHTPPQARFALGIGLYSTARCRPVRSKSARPSSVGLTDTFKVTFEVLRHVTPNDLCGLCEMIDKLMVWVFPSHLHPKIDDFGTYGNPRPSTQRRIPALCTGQEGGGKTEENPQVPCENAAIKAATGTPTKYGARPRLYLKCGKSTSTNRTPGSQ
eukprot:4184555-Amphidinium_carterae.1